MGEALGGSPGLEVLVGRSGGVVRGEAVAKLVPDQHGSNGHARRARRVAATGPAERRAGQGGLLEEAVYERADVLAGGAVVAAVGCVARHQPAATMQISWPFETPS